MSVFTASVPPVMNGTGFRSLRVRTGLCYLTAMKAKAVVVIDPDIMSGTPCFAGTRVPVRSLLDYLEAGDSLDLFLEQFPTVSRDQAIGFLERSADAMLKSIPQAA